MNKEMTPFEALDRLYKTTYNKEISRKDAYLCLEGLIYDYFLLKKFAEKTLKGENENNGI